MVAIDLDEGLNGKVTYEMRVGMPRMDFVINNTTGLVTSTVVLDRERISEYYLRVVASDAGSPSKSSTSTLTVRGNSQLTLSWFPYVILPIKSRKNVPPNALHVCMPHICLLL